MQTPLQQRSFTPHLFPQAPQLVVTRFQIRAHPVAAVSLTGAVADAAPTNTLDATEGAVVAAAPTEEGISLQVHAASAAQAQPSGAIADPAEADLPALGMRCRRRRSGYGRSAGSHNRRRTPSAPADSPPHRLPGCRTGRSRTPCRRRRSASRHSAGPRRRRHRGSVPPRSRSAQCPGSRRSHRCCTRPPRSSAPPRSTPRRSPPGRTGSRDRCCTHCLPGSPLRRPDSSRAPSRTPVGATQTLIHGQPEADARLVHTVREAACQRARQRTLSRLEAGGRLAAGAAASGGGEGRRGRGREAESSSAPMPAAKPTARRRISSRRERPPARSFARASKSSRGALSGTTG